MLDDKDIQKMMEVFPTKDDLKEAVANLATKDDFNDLQTSVDTYAQKADTYFQEMTMLTHKVNRLEKWIQQVAERVGLKLEY